MSEQKNTPARTVAGAHSAQSDTGGVSAAAFEKYLKKIHFPVSREGILGHLKKNNATQDILKIADKFQRRSYHSVAEIAKEFSQAKKG